MKMNHMVVLRNGNGNHGNGNGNGGNGNGEVKVPIGFRFRPTDEEVVVHYLRRRAHSLPLPASIIPDLDVFHSDPWSLPGELREKRYYFWKRKRELGSKCSRMSTTSSGFWKAIGKGKKIISSSSKNDVVGSRKSWAFYQSKKNDTHGQFWSNKTRWFMHEFQLVNSTESTRNHQMQDNWVVCRVFQRKTRPKNRRINQATNCCNNSKGEFNIKIINSSNNPNIIDFKVDNINSFDLGPPSPSSSSTTNDLDNHVESNCCYY